jgi:hypothetical protein
MGKSATLYKVIFHSAGKIYELYANAVISSDLFGFVRVSGIELDQGEGLVIDPTGERLREEFADVRSLHLPMHTIVRVEEVDKRHALKILDGGSGEKIMPFPIGIPNRGKTT